MGIRFNFVLYLVDVDRAKRAVFDTAMVLLFQFDRWLPGTQHNLAIAVTMPLILKTALRVS